MNNRFFLSKIKTYILLWLVCGFIINVQTQADDYKVLTDELGSYILVNGQKLRMLQPNNGASSSPNNQQPPQPQTQPQPQSNIIQFQQIQQKFQQKFNQMEQNTNPLLPQPPTPPQYPQFNKPNASPSQIPNQHWNPNLPQDIPYYRQNLEDQFNSQFPYANQGPNNQQFNPSMINNQPSINDMPPPQQQPNLRRQYTRGPFSFTNQPKQQNFQQYQQPYQQQPQQQQQYQKPYQSQGYQQQQYQQQQPYQPGQPPNQFNPYQFQQPNQGYPGQAFPNQPKQLPLPNAGMQNGLMDPTSVNNFMYVIDTRPSAGIPYNPLPGNVKSQGQYAWTTTNTF